jgi:MoaA/NifB/PqqE/SkfB family radical SAM enzyme
LQLRILPDVLYKRFYEGLNYRLRLFAGGKWAAHCRPVTIVFLLTERCNARCIHCSIWQNRAKEEPPSVEALKSTLHELREWLGPVQVTFSGGEALLKPYTTELVRYASSLGLLVEVLTHGYWEDQARIEALARARPWRVTVSFDGIGEVHNKIRGRDDFFEKTSATIETLRRKRGKKEEPVPVLLKTVIMQHNLEHICNIAEFAAERNLQVFYQPIEQNYNTTEDPEWFQHSENWPIDPNRAVEVVNQLIAMKHRGKPIMNSVQQLQAMAAYFKAPAELRVAVQNHTAHEPRPICSALTNIQVQANGDVVLCPSIPAVGNIKNSSIRDIWRNRPHLWEKGCCLDWRVDQKLR